MQSEDTRSPAYNIGQFLTGHLSFLFETMGIVHMHQKGEAGYMAFIEPYSLQSALLQVKDNAS